eukprot:2593536-Prymnesium_polylepis.1
MQMRGNKFFDYLMTLIPLRQETVRWLPDSVPCVACTSRRYILACAPDTCTSLPAQANDLDAFLERLLKTDAYQYFVALKQMKEDELQAMLGRVLLFLVEASGEPVLLSMLVLIFSDGDEDMSRLPGSRLQLYETALSEAIKRRLQIEQQANGEGKEAEQLDGAAEAAAEKEAKKEAKEEREETKEEAEMRRKAARKATTAAYMGSKTTKFSTDAKSVDLVYAEYGHALRVLAEDKSGMEFRNIIQKSVPKHMRQDTMTLVEESRKPPTAQTRQVGFQMLQQVAVANQIGGRREFSSKDVVTSLAQHTEELIHWMSLECDKERGVMMIKTLEEATRNAPAQYQFTHLSFQEGLYAMHLLKIVDKPDWTDWDTDSLASAFLNNRFLNNTCCIASGKLGTLLAQRRSKWDFSAQSGNALSLFGRQSLWFICQKNEALEALDLTESDVKPSDTAGLCKLIATCSHLQKLGLGSNGLGKMDGSQLRQLSQALTEAHSLIELDLSSNQLGRTGVEAVARALCECPMLQVLNLSYNEPGDRFKNLLRLIRTHKELRSLSMIERRKEDFGTNG